MELSKNSRGGGMNIIAEHNSIYRRGNIPYILVNILLFIHPYSVDISVVLSNSTPASHPPFFFLVLGMN
jgi:hypothetical protein